MINLQKGIRFLADGGLNLLAVIDCADRCLARMACPYFPQMRYTMPQIQYHYGRSLDSLRVWYGDDGK